MYICSKITELPLGYARGAQRILKIKVNVDEL